MDQLEVVIIEDSEKQAIEIKQAYENCVQMLEQNNRLEDFISAKKVNIEWFNTGRRTKIGGKDIHRFYDESVYDKLATKLEEVQKKSNSKLGILLDVALSRDEFKKVNLNDFTDYKIAKGIYEQFKEDAGIYIITSIRNYSSYVLSLMGTKDLQKRYITKSLICEYPLFGAIARTLRYMNTGDSLTEEQEDEINEMASKYEERKGC